MKKFMIKFGVVLGIVAICAVVVLYSKFKAQKPNKTKQLFNVVMVGAAGSGKGTQSELIKNDLNLIQISMGELLRQTVKNGGKYAEEIKSYTDKGELVPSKISFALLGDYLTENVYCDTCKYNGVIFDGFPRSMDQLEFLDKYLAEKGNKVNAVVYIDVPMEALVERLSGRFACSKCGELYHKITKPTKVEGTCDKCGGHEFTVRDDDKDTDAIRKRFKIFEENSGKILDVYNQRGIVVKVDGTKTPAEIATVIKEELAKKKNN